MSTTTDSGSDDSPLEDISVGESGLLEQASADGLLSRSLQGKRQKEDRKGKIQPQDQVLGEGKDTVSVEKHPKITLVKNVGGEGSEDEDTQDAKEASKRAKKVLRDLRKKHKHDSNVSYRVKNKRKGIAAIFNIGKFEEFMGFGKDVESTSTSTSHPRNGYLIDGVMMRKVWADLGFDVKYYQDLRTKEIEKILKELSSEPHRDADCFVLVFMSYGGADLEDDMLCSTDGLLTVRFIVQHFNARNTPSLTGKPKLFFIQACRGSKVDRGVVVKDIETDSKSRRARAKTVPIEADNLLCQSTVRGYTSFSHTDSGSVYVKYLAHVLSVYGQEKDINWILTKVNSMVAEDYNEYSLKDDDIRKQMPVFTSMLTKQLFLK